MTSGRRRIPGANFEAHKLPLTRSGEQRSRPMAGQPDTTIERAWFLARQRSAVTTIFLGLWSGHAWAVENFGPFCVNDKRINALGLIQRIGPVAFALDLGFRFKAGDLKPIGQRHQTGFPRHPRQFLRLRKNVFGRFDG